MGETRREIGPQPADLRGKRHRYAQRAIRDVEVPRVWTLNALLGKPAPCVGVVPPGVGDRDRPQAGGLAIDVHRTCGAPSRRG